MIFDESTNEKCLISNLHNPFTFIICNLILQRVVRYTYILQGQIDGMSVTKNIWGFSTSTIDPANFTTDVVTVMIWATFWCPTLSMTSRNNLEMKFLSLYSLVLSMDFTKSGHFSNIAIKLISGLFGHLCTHHLPCLNLFLSKYL